MTFQLVDTHCHINFHEYNDDREAMLERAQARGVTRIIIPATDLASSQSGIAMSDQYKGVYAAIGIHPNSTATFEEGDIAALNALMPHANVVAVGEIGLDYYWDKSPAEIQKRAFQAQLELAQRLDLPVIIHNRDAHEDVMAMLEAWAKDLPASLKDRPGVLHSFSAPPDIAQRALAIGFFLGFTGPLTFKKAEDLRQIARTVPLDRLLVETDGPFLTPEPYRGKRNEPAYVYYIADRLAALHGLTTEDMGRITTKNAERLFRI